MKKFAVLALIASFCVAFGVLVKGYKVGDQVKDFSLKNVDGKMVSLSDYNTSNGVILIFDCNTCPYSKRYNERILELDKKYSSKGFPVIAINPNDEEVSPGDSFDKMVSHAASNNYTFAYLQDRDQTVAKTFGATNTPHVFILQHQRGTWTVAYIGTIDDNARDASDVTVRYVEDAVDALLEGKRVPTETTKAIGCSIKWSRS